MKLRYRIVSYSSQQKDFPVTNIMFSQTIDKPWESIRFCDYPQQITIQFYEPVTISSLTIICHPKKIPTKISILYCLPERDNFPTEGLKFRKFGFLQPGLNRQTNYKCRECRQINQMNINALYLRFVLWKNHQNPWNFFNQVGLSQISAMGSPHVNLASSALPALQNKSVLLGLSSEEYVQTKVEMLEQFKHQFAKQDDFQGAKRMVQIIRVIRSEGSQLCQLDEKKKQAIKQEDYSKAKQIKEQMAQVRKKMEQISNNFSALESKSLRPVLQDSRVKSKQQQRDLAHSQASRHSAGMLSMDEKEQFQDQEGPPEKEYAYLSKSQVSYENRILPAILHKNRKDLKELLKTEENLEDAAYQDNQFIQKYEKQKEEPNQLAPADQANASVPIQVFGKETIKKLYSKSYDHKMKGLGQISHQCRAMFNPKDTRAMSKDEYRATVFVFNRIIKQGSYPLLKVVLEVMNTMLTGAKSKDQTVLSELRNEMHNELQKSIHELLLKMCENSKIKQKSEQIIKAMLKTELYGINFVYHAFQKSYVTSQSSKVKRNKLVVLQTIVLENGVGGKSGLPLHSIDFACKAASDSHSQVRKEAAILLKLMKSRGGGQRVVEAVKICPEVKGSILKEIAD